MLIKKAERKRYANSPRCTAYEYDHKDKDINIALITINGRYPDKGRVMNKVCKEIVFVVKGKGKMEINGKKIMLNEGDSVFVKPNQRYFFDGRLRIITSCNPSWYPKQHVMCD